jgi:hypothetical protein
MYLNYIINLMYLNYIINVTFLICVSNLFEGQGKSMYPLSANTNVLSVTPRLMVTC